MNLSPAPVAHAAHYELRFINLFNRGRGFVFPCNAAGEVELAGLSDPGRINYQRASAAAGVEFSLPVVAAVHPGVAPAQARAEPSIPAAVAA